MKGMNPQNDHKSIQNERKVRKKKRVCLYYATDEATDRESFTKTHEAITELINNTAGWKYEKLYIDHPGEHEAFEDMMRDCSLGNIDVIVTKSIWRFSGDMAENFRVIDRLAGMDPPIEIIFSDEALFSSDVEKLKKYREFALEITGCEEKVE